MVLMCQPVRRKGGGEGKKKKKSRLLAPGIQILFGRERRGKTYEEKKRGEKRERRKTSGRVLPLLHSWKKRKEASWISFLVLECRQKEKKKNAGKKKKRGEGKRRFHSFNSTVEEGEKERKTAVQPFGREAAKIASGRGKRRRHRLSNHLKQARRRRGMGANSLSPNRVQNPTGKKAEGASFLSLTRLSREKGGKGEKSSPFLSSVTQLKVK